MDRTFVLCVLVAAFAALGSAEAAPSSPDATDRDRVPEDRGAALAGDGLGPPGSDPCRPNCLDWVRS